MDEPKAARLLERVTWFRQAAIRFAGSGTTLYLDPWGTSEEDPAADVIFITHAHFDHLQPREVERLRSDGTTIVAPKDVADELSGRVVPVGPGESHEVAGVRFETVPAYNVVEERLDMHPQRNGWVGYLIEVEGGTLYHAGDTDALPGLERLGPDVAMVPIGGTYTMDYREAAGSGFWLQYVDVENLEASKKKAQGLGAKVLWEEGAVKRRRSGFTSSVQPGPRLGSGTLAGVVPMPIMRCHRKVLQQPLKVLSVRRIVQVEGVQAPVSVGRTPKTGLHAVP